MIKIFQIYFEEANTLLETLFYIFIFLICILILSNLVYQVFLQLKINHELLSELKLYEKEIDEQIIKIFKL